MEQLKSGIYQILNEKTNDSYVGSAINITYRWQRHRKDLRGNRHHSTILQRAFTKYKENSFKYLILEYCEPNLLADRENYYFDVIKPIYNICPKAYSQVGKKLSDEHKEKLRKYAKENNVKPPESTYGKKRKKICMIDMNTLEVLKHFNSISEACNFLGKDYRFVNTLSKVCRGIRNSAFGYKWKFE